MNAYAVCAPQCTRRIHEDIRVSPYLEAIYHGIIVNPWPERMYRLASRPEDLRQMRVVRSGRVLPAITDGAPFLIVRDDIKTLLGRCKGFYFNPIKYEKLVDVAMPEDTKSVPFRRFMRDPDRYFLSLPDATSFFPDAPQYWEWVVAPFRFDLVPGFVSLPERKRDRILALERSGHAFVARNLSTAKLNRLGAVFAHGTIMSERVFRCIEQHIDCKFLAVRRLTMAS